jgi:hypothetical protein
MMLWQTALDHSGPIHLQIDPAPEYRPRCNAHSVNDKRKSDHHPWWDKTTACMWRALFVSTVWSSDGGFVPIGDVVAGDVWWGPALQQAYKPSVQASLSLLRTVWALMEGLYVPGVTQAVVVAILYLSRRCDVWMYLSCAGVVTRSLPLQGRSAVHSVSLYRFLRCLTVRILPFIALATSAVLQLRSQLWKLRTLKEALRLTLKNTKHQGPPCLIACLRHFQADEQEPWCLVFFRVSRKASFVSYIFITVSLIAYHL